MKNTTKKKHSHWQSIVAKYENPHLWRSCWQLVNSLVPYLLICWLMYLSLEISYILTLLLSLLAGGFLVRIFIIFHDCGHGSFFKSSNANDFWGVITGILTLTPYHFWRHSHAQHHASAGNLDKRGVGDIWTMTVEEYLKSSRWKRFAYRFSRHPVGLLLVGPTFFFLIRNRFSSANATKRDRISVVTTNLALITIAAWMDLTIGLKSYLLIQVPNMMVAATAGVWLFYVQHQFEGVYWERHPDWDYVDEALKGSSFYKLPKILQWFTGNIGFHHIHHLSPKIPNYLLEKCYNANAMFREIKPVTLFTSLKSLTFRLWDEKRHRLVGFDILKSLRKERVINYGKS